MFIFQVMLMAIRGLRANLLRSLLAVMGVIIGVAAVISAMSILEGAKNDIMKRVESMGSETITVIPAVAKSGGRNVGQVQTLKVEDADRLVDHRVCPNIESAAPEVSTAASIKYFGRNKEATVLGTSEAYAEIFNYKVAPGQGEFFRKEDVNAEQKVVVLGHKIAKDLFGGAPAVGSFVKIRGIPFHVIGVMEKKGSLGFRSVDSQVMIPITTAMRRLIGIDFVHAITVKAVGAGQVDMAETEIKRELRRAHQISFRNGQKDDFMLFSQEESRRQVRDFTNIFAVVLYSIAGISLVVGGIGIMNIMLVSVTERTREIGVRMAVGAQRLDILGQFVIEASIISLFGGGFGVALGSALNNVLENATHRLFVMHMTYSVVVYALTMAIITGIVSGIYPAYKASRLDPVEALRYE